MQLQIVTKDRHVDLDLNRNLMSYDNLAGLVSLDATSPMVYFRRQLTDNRSRLRSWKAISRTMAHLRQ